MKRCTDRALALLLALFMSCVLGGCQNVGPVEVPAPDGSDLTVSRSEPAVSVTVPSHTEKEETGPEIQTPPRQETEPPEPETDSELCVRFIDVGQADCALLECGGHYMLIDGGNREDSDLVYSVLKALDVSHLDIVVGTHAHEDHIGGIPGAFQYATADMTLSPVTSYSTATFDKFAGAAQSRGGGLSVPEAGDTYWLGDTQITVLGLNGGKDTNDTSIVLKAQLGQVSFLFTGDAERSAEEVILGSGADISATVLKVGHHGSSSSTSYPFLRQILPLYAVVSVGRDNDYGHPEREVLDRLEAAEADVLRTDELGDIVFTTDGRTVDYVTGKNAASVPFVKHSKPVPQDRTDPSVTVPEPLPQQPESAEETQRETEPGAPTEDTVWIARSGKKYHSYAGCSSMKDPSQVTLSQAQSRGYSPCKRCF